MSTDEKIARQVAGTMAIEGMHLNQNELALVLACANGEKSTTAAIKELVEQYTVK